MVVAGTSFNVEARTSSACVRSLVSSYRAVEQSNDMEETVKVRYMWRSICAFAALLKALTLFSNCYLSKNSVTVSDHSTDVMDMTY